MLSPPPSTAPAPRQPRPRRDGWSVERVARFLDSLAETGCVRDACRVVGLSNQSAYRRRAAFAGFASDWDGAIARAQTGLIAVAHKHATQGKETIIMRNGQEYERRIAPSDSILGLLLKRIDARSPDDGYNRDDVITFEESQRAITFNHEGKKIQGYNADEEKRQIIERFDRATAWTARRVAKTNTCWHCGQPLTDEARENMLNHSPAIRIALGDYVMGYDERGGLIYTPREFKD